MQTIRASLAMLALLVLSACYVPVTLHPLGSTTGLKTDPAILGSWKGKGDDDEHKTGFYHFLTQSDGTVIALLVPGKGKATDVLIAKMTMTRLGKNGFLNVRLMDNMKTETKDQPAGTVPVLYRIDAKGTLSLYMLDETLTKDAIKAHKIAGTDGQTTTGDAAITADGPALDKFFASPAGVALFAKPFAVLHRDD